MSDNNIEARARSLHAWDARIRLLQEHDRRGAELERLKAKLRDPAVKAVVELAEQCDQEYRRAEAAHEAKDEANRRWLEATTAPAVAAQLGARETRAAIVAGVELLLRDLDPDHWPEAVTALQDALCVARHAAPQPAANLPDRQDSDPCADICHPGHGACCGGDPEGARMRGLGEQDAAIEPEIPNNPFPPGDPRGWVKYQNCVTDLCAIQRQHTPSCPARDKGAIE